MKTLEKPSIHELLDAVKLTHDNKDEPNSDEYHSKMIALFRRNEAAIQNNWDNGKHNQQAFDELIKSIELNGMRHFNMSVFMGSIADDWWQRYDSVNAVTAFYEKESSNKQYLDDMTTSFNCNTVGCIAGFATAVAMNWNSEEWLKGMPFVERNDAFVNIACNYLNIPKVIGERIFYGEQGSVWAFVKDNVQGFHDIEFSLEYDEDGDEYSWWEKEVDLNSIGYKQAAEVLRMINTGEIEFDTSYYEPYLAKEKK